MVAPGKVHPQMESIPSDEVRFHPHSFADDAGRLFSWRGQLYRGINSAQAPFFSRLFNEGVIDELIRQRLLVGTEKTNLVFPPFAMIVRHQTVPFVSYPNEWPAAMLKDAALTTINLAIELAERGLTLKDAHPWNLLFSASQAVYVDLTSISPAKGADWSAYDEFCRFCYYPLILIAHGQERIARSLLPEYQGIQRGELLTILRGSGPSRFMLSKALARGTKSLRSIFAKPSQQSLLPFLKHVRRDVASIPLSSATSSQADAFTVPRPSDERRFDSRRLRRPLSRILFEVQPRTVLDVSRGHIWTSTFPARMGLNTVSVSTYSARASALYRIARDKGLQILPLIMDFIKPTPSIGYSNHYSVSATERMKCDLVLALGIVHEVATMNRLNFDLIAEGLSSFSKRWLVVDFNERRLSAGNGAKGTLIEFLEALRKRFREVTIISSGVDTGALLLCEKEAGGDEQ